MKLENNKLFDISDTIKLVHPIKEKKIKKYITYHNSSKIKNCCLVKYSAKSDSLYLYKLDGEKLSRGVNLSKVLKRELQHYVVNSHDSIFVLNYNNELFMINSKGKIKNRWDFNGKILDNGNKTYTIMGMATTPIAFRNNHFYAIQTRNVRGLGKNTESNKKYYNSNAGITIKLKSDTFFVNNEIGEYPGIYKESNKFYYEFHPSKTLGHNNYIVFSFALSDTIYAFKSNKLIKKIDASSPFFQKPKPFNKDSLKNYKYISKYQSTQSRYQRIIYNQYRDLYYRIVSHEQPYKNEDGTINRAFDRPWSVMVLDTNFNRLKEVVMPGGKFEYNGTLVTKKGILLKAYEQSKIAQPNRITYYLLDIKK